jgi:small GTP-binding protein
MVEKKINLKLALFGDPAVGKTSLISRYTEEGFEENYQPTLGVNIVMKKMNIDEFVIQLAIWDIAGQEKYDLTRKMFFQGCMGALLVYDITRQPTYENIESKWLTDFEKYAEKDPTCVLIGNKTDLEDSKVVFMEDGRLLAEQINASDFLEISAKLGDNVEAAFKKLVFKALSKFGIEIGKN